tara:strand:+ start:2073 stop:2843 length:771 start_codon:yes stop_codon:yes gene_type:complete
MTQGSKSVRRSNSIPGRFSRFILNLFGNRPPAQIGVIVIGLNILVIAAALLLPPARESPMYYFKGPRLISFMSLVQLIVIAALAWQVYLERLAHSEETLEDSRGPHSRHLWLVICLGFFFMAVDEITAVHLYLDRAISAFGTHTGRIHGITVSFYSIGAIGVLIFFRREFVTFRRSWLPFAAAFFCLVVAIAFDSMVIYKVEPWLPEFCDIFLSRSGRGITEESLELFSEGFFITALYTSAVEARRIGGNDLANSN